MDYNRRLIIISEWDQVYLLRKGIIRLTPNLLKIEAAIRLGDFVFECGDIYATQKDFEKWTIFEI